MTSKLASMPISIFQGRNSVDTRSRSSRGATPAALPEKRLRRSWLLKTTSSIGILAIATAWALRPEGAGAEPPPAAAQPQVTVSTPLSRELEERLPFLGQFAAVDMVELRAQVGGTLTGIYFKDGDTVHKGDLLFTIDPRPYDIKLAQAKALVESSTARVALADRELRRAQELAKSNAGSVQNVEQRTAEQRAAQAAVDDARAQVRDAQFDLDHCRIVSPFSGRIGSHLVSVGNLIAGSRAATSPTTLLATVVSTDPIYFRFEMSEADYQAFSRAAGEHRTSPSNPVELALGSGNKFDLRGTLDFIDNVLDRSSGTIVARATVANERLILTPGEFARARLAIGKPKPTLLVPDAAVMQDQSQHVVLTVSSDSTVVPKRVEVGSLRGGLRTIRSGLAATDRVVIDGLPYASPGAKVAAKDGAIKYAEDQD